MKTRAALKNKGKAEEPRQCTQLITSATRKRCASQNLGTPARKRVCSKAVPQCQDLPQNEEAEPVVRQQSFMGHIFSPVLHIFKTSGGGECSTTGSGAQEVTEGTVLLRHEEGQESVVSNSDEQDVDEEDAFDPYLFIKQLPKLSDVVPHCRDVILPKRTRRCPPITLVLDLDETLVHSTLDDCHGADFSFPVQFNFSWHMVHVRRRPHLEMFMEKVSQLFEIIVFTASQSIYAEKVLNILDPKRRYFRHRIYRDSCVFVDGNYLKDLSVLGRDLSKTIIVDNSPQAFGFQVDNGIPIESWFDDQADTALASLLPFLESLVGVDDVRPVIAKTYNLREKIEAATEFPKSRLLRA